MRLYVLSTKASHYPFLPTQLMCTYIVDLINKNFLKHNSIIVDPNWPQGSEQHQREGYVPSSSKGMG